MNNRTPGKKEKGASRVSGAKRSNPRRVWLGPGTVMALLVAGIAIGVGRLNDQAQAFQGAGRVVYEADSQGRLQRVSAPGETPAGTAVKPLWKPEVSLLIERRRDLGLSAAQQKLLTPLNDAWLADKASLHAALNGLSREVKELAPSDGSHGASLRAIQSGMGDYSNLSRQYDAQRASYWLKGATILNAMQRRMIDGWAASGTPGRVQ